MKLSVFAVAAASEQAPARSHRVLCCLCTVLGMVAALGCSADTSGSVKTAAQGGEFAQASGASGSAAAPLPSPPRVLILASLIPYDRDSEYEDTP
jgi:hypothetical protein